MIIGSHSRTRTNPAQPVPRSASRWSRTVSIVIGQCSASIQQKSMPQSPASSQTVGSLIEITAPMETRLPRLSKNLFFIFISFSSISMRTGLHA